MGKLNTSGIQQGKDCMMSQASNKLARPASPTATVGSVPTNKKMILNVKNPSCKKNTQTMKLSQTLEVGLISKERSSSGFWNKQVSGMSEKLWLPTEIDSVDLDLNSSNGSSLSTMSNSWFSTKVKVPHKQSSLLTCSRLSQFSPVGFTDSESTLFRSKKIRVYPNKHQKILLFKWFGVSRYVYNKTVEYLRQPDTKANWMLIKTDIIKNLPEWAKEVPYQIKAIAIKDACKAVKKAKMDFKRTGKLHKVGFRSRRKGDFSVYVPKSAVRADGFYRSILGSMNVRESIGSVELDCRFTLVNGRYYISKPELRAIKIPENQRNPVVALDPGVRTFQTLYSQEFSLSTGDADFAKIYRLCNTLDKLYSLRKKKITNRYDSKLKRLRWRIKDLINEIHHKLALFLVKSFEVILIPSFETSNMVTKLRSKVARSMLTWAHYRFKQFLKNKAEEYSCRVIEVNEAYTSKTCTKCGLIHNIGSKKLMECSCGLVLNRDLNGARNIFLKNISLALKDSSTLDVYSGVNLS